MGRDGRAGDQVSEALSAPRLHAGSPDHPVVGLVRSDYNDHVDQSGDDSMADMSWTVAQAKAKFSELLDRVQQAGPQTITRSGRLAAVVVSAEEWARKTQRVGNLAEFLAASPLRGSRLKIVRPRDRPRPIKL
jgi:prevent-host-death family protein